jgi:hypothetical protein
VEDKPARVWNSLEIAKILVTVLLAAVGGLFTYVTYQQGRLDRAAEQRMSVWREASPVINDIYAYNMFIGQFKDLTPSKIIEDKRKLDKLMYTNQVLFSRGYFQAYQLFMNTAFQSYNGWLADPSLRTIPVRPNDSNSNVQFTNQDCRNEIFEAYWNLQNLSAAELAVYQPNPGRQPNAAPDISDPTKQVLVENASACTIEQ